MKKLVSGTGLNDNKWPARIDNKELKEYGVWVNMLSRCNPKFWVRCPTYSGTTCSENFKLYSFFYEWCQTQVGFGNTDERGMAWNLDKDLLIKSNKIYSEDTCVFLPQKINKLLTKSLAARGNYPVGVCFHKRDKRFAVKCNNGNVNQKYLGNFNTAEEAFQAYRAFKEAYIKEVANEYRTQLDPRAYEALLNYEVNIND